MITNENKKILDSLTKEKLEDLIPRHTSMSMLFKFLNVRYDIYTIRYFHELRKTLKIKLDYKRTHPDLKRNIFKTINTKEKAYWLGFIAADGHVPAKSNSVAFSMSVKDELHFNRFLKFIGANPAKKRYFVGNSNNQMFQIDISDRFFSNNIKKHGIISPKSQNLRMIKFKNKSLTRAFILGIFDGDGSSRNGHATLCSGSIELLKDIQKQFKSDYKISEKPNKWGSVFIMSLCPYQVSKAQNENKGYNLVRKNIRTIKRNWKTVKTKPIEVFFSPDTKHLFGKNELCNCGRKKNKIAKVCFTCRKEILTKSFLISKDQLIKDLTQIKNITYIGKKYSVSANSIMHYIRRYKISNYKTYLTKARRYNSKMDNQINKFYEKRKTIQATAKHFRMDENSIKKVVQSSPTYKAQIAQRKKVQKLKAKIISMKSTNTFTEIAKKLKITRVRAKSLYYS